MTQSLNSKQERALARASRTRMVAAAGEILGELASDRWLPPANRYRVDAQRELRQSANGKELSQYMVASVPVHTADGWGYLGRALHAHTRGDHDAARHLAYYAELRAAIALLASEGIGIFNTSHFSITRNGGADKVPGAKRGKQWRPLGTHVASWLFLEYWAELAACSVTLGAIIYPWGETLSKWVDAALKGSIWKPFGSELLGGWGLDLQRLAFDRDARNEASYQANALKDRTQLEAGEAAKLVGVLWEPLEPRPSSPFEYLDRCLLRRTLERAARATKPEGKTVQDNLVQCVDRALSDLMPSGPSRGEARKFLLRQIEPHDPEVLGLASQNPPVGAPEHHFTVIARALLLLRVAAGACRRLLFDGGITSDDCEWWWDKLSRERGLSVETPEDLLAEWTTIEDSMGEVDDWDANPATYFRLLEDLSQPLTRLGRTELVPAWTLAA